MSVLNSTASAVTVPASPVVLRGSPVRKKSSFRSRKRPSLIVTMGMSTTFSKFRRKRKVSLINPPFSVSCEETASSDWSFESFTPITSLGRKKSLPRSVPKPPVTPVLPHRQLKTTNGFMRSFSEVVRRESPPKTSSPTPAGDRLSVVGVPTRRRPEPVSELDENSSHHEQLQHQQNRTDSPDNSRPSSTHAKRNSTSINRSESYSERVQKRKSTRESRKHSDPSLTGAKDSGAAHSESSPVAMVVLRRYISNVSLEFDIYRFVAAAARFVAIHILFPRGLLSLSRHPAVAGSNSCVFHPRLFVHLRHVLEKEEGRERKSGDRFVISHPSLLLAPVVLEMMVDISDADSRMALCQAVSHSPRPFFSVKSDADLHNATSLQNNTESSSNSSISTSRSIESPSNSMEGGSLAPSVNEPLPLQALFRASAGPGDDSDGETASAEWQRDLDPAILQRMSQQEIKRQDILNELFHTEKNHVRKLTILKETFYDRLRQYGQASDVVDNLFTNLEEMLEIHSGFYEQMKRCRGDNPVIEEVGDLLLSMFDGEAGPNFARAAATFCRSQSASNQAFKVRRLRDQELDRLVRESESDRRCQRLKLNDLIVSEMQRLTKYPLLLENLLKLKISHPTELDKVERALIRSKDIVNHVNEETNNYQRIHEILKRIDRVAFDKGAADDEICSHFKNLDWFTFRVIHEGCVTWRQPHSSKAVDVQLLLTSDYLIFLQKDGEKLVLKFHSCVAMGKEDKVQVSPVIRLKDLILRHEAGGKNILLILVTHPKFSYMYKIQAPGDTEERERLSLVNILERRRGSFVREGSLDQLRTNGLASSGSPSAAPSSPSTSRGRRWPSPAVLVERRGSISFSGDHSPHTQERRGSIGSIIVRWFKAINDAKTAYLERSKQTENLCLSGDVPDSLHDNREETEAAAVTEEAVPEREGASGGGSTSLGAGSTDAPQDDEGRKKHHAQASTSGKRFQRGVVLTLVEGPRLIEPSEVVISQGPASVFFAEPVITPLERLRKKDLEIKKKLEEKEAIVADILRVPKEEFAHISDIAEHGDGEKDARELVLILMNVAKRLSELLNDSLRVSEEDTVQPPNKPLGVPYAQVKDISDALNQHLPPLVNKIDESEMERSRLRAEAGQSREQLHRLHLQSTSRKHVEREYEEIPPIAGPPPEEPVPPPYSEKPEPPEVSSSPDTSKAEEEDVSGLEDDNEEDEKVS
ncbi:unnamed protein product [Cyprideis torosa]|uniref:Uncharacterized protein n=1 Tax=Cyprideis torosa TaxID=163714 RepID=A0A7R8ZHB0_9CRUS|nr:unnamed protein product [Cyprideis torosa]CAG0882122.1 unnamed protein product [Cyprideis torosa]